MKTEKFYCDKCKTENNLKTLMPVEISFGVFGQTCIGTYNRPVQSKTLQLCEMCAVKCGFIKPVTKDDITINETQDIRERLYDIFAELIADIKE